MARAVPGGIIAFSATQDVAGLIGPGDRKSVQLMAVRGGEAGYDQLHHVVAARVRNGAPLEAALLSEADRLVGGAGALPVIGDTAMPKKERHSVGVAPQHASSPGKNANCQTMVSVTLASREVPVMTRLLRLFLPESWTSDPARLTKAKVPAGRQAAPTKLLSMTSPAKLPSRASAPRQPVDAMTR